MSANNILEKGIYNHPQPSGCMTVKQYIIIEKNKKRCLLLRFCNESGLNITDMGFTVTQLDSAGEVIETSTVKSAAIRVNAGLTFSLKKAVVLNRRCTDFIVTVTWVISKGYKYEVRNGQMVPHFDTRGFDTSEAKPARSYSSAKARGNPGGAIVALVSTLLVLAFVGLSILRSSQRFGKFDTAGTGAASYVGESTCL